MCRDIHYQSLLWRVTVTSASGSAAPFMSPLIPQCLLNSDVDRAVEGLGKVGCAGTQLLALPPRAPQALCGHDLCLLSLFLADISNVASPRSSRMPALAFV